MDPLQATAKNAERQNEMFDRVDIVDLSVYFSIIIIATQRVFFSRIERMHSPIRSFVRHFRFIEPIHYYYPANNQ